MPRVGNNGNCGKKGRSGRKSFYQEQADAERLMAAFFEGIELKNIKNIEDLLEQMKLKKGGKKKIKLFDVMILRALQNSKPGMDVLINLMKKVFPDKAETKTKDEGMASLLKALHEGGEVDQPPEEPPSKNKQ